MRNITRRAIKNKAQFGRFALVGGINTVIDFGILFLLTYLGVPRIIANTLSTGIAFIIRFFANKKYTFRSTSKNLKREILLFVIVTLFGLWVLQNFVIWLISPFIHNFIANNDLALLAAKLIGTGVSMTWNYLMYARIVFDNEKDAKK